MSTCRPIEWAKEGRDPGVDGEVSAIDLASLQESDPCNTRSLEHPDQEDGGRVGRGVAGAPAKGLCPVGSSAKAGLVCGRDAGTLVVQGPHFSAQGICMFSQYASGKDRPPSCAFIRSHIVSELDTPLYSSAM